MDQQKSLVPIIIIWRCHNNKSQLTETHSRLAQVSVGRSDRSQVKACTCSSLDIAFGTQGIIISLVSANFGKIAVRPRHPVRTSCDIRGYYAFVCQV